ncbi:bifunctional phosphopantothenoylcysteine decarboxylase/phosphopantothenate--cysteine ligase CoaBC [Prosthecochloris sp. GSB1]|uniref:bifunctional phosphopantothenoylcysteine decarboxylase/phosphopantothenate--cysteine ligase CoaBC n=1 Tax=Prosthecochloris sp. GSB1 TaxID=281093 RepID=UPI000B8CAD2A|nr:bifunctional phosphopantothenoylcysteine decarboxylase/phosphopantothenate--cysteine ligase CoaBC [Prosthecochloris sp. GSB1]ASQ89820.1 bifunctional phosphopantothenoylcysteine decarboxylase/phosphopantothenate--cysteine ligase CoaBC [Prosthecochloris sp. GSB1]
MAEKETPSVLAGKNILLGICGGIAAYKMPMLIRLLKKQGADVRVVVTGAATRFVTELTLSTLSQAPVFKEVFPRTAEAETDWTRHISLGEWADAYVIAPATANTIARLAAGICDDMLTTCFITLRPKKPKILFPAMDGGMYSSASVQKNLAWLSGNGCLVVEPESGDLASGQCGTGRMPEPDVIAATIEQAIEKEAGNSLLRGKSIVVTAGPTREKIDGVRFISNYSSGKMGFAIAGAAASRGASVTLISGPVHLETPRGVVTRRNVESAEEMQREAALAGTGCDIFIGAAAVADYRPEKTAEGKIRKTNGNMALTLVRTPDIIEEFARRKQPHQLAIGFSLEPTEELRNAEEKLRRKNLDLIACNTFDGTTTGFDVDTNRLTLINRRAETVRLPLLDKQEAAEHLLDAVEELMAGERGRQAVGGKILQSGTGQNQHEA